MLHSLVDSAQKKYFFEKQRFLYQLFCISLNVHKKEETTKWNSVNHLYRT